MHDRSPHQPATPAQPSPTIAPSQPIEFVDAPTPAAAASLDVRRDAFLSPGTILRPGPIGRAVRAVLGLASLNLAVSAVVLPGLLLATEPPVGVGWYVGIVIGLLVTAQVVNVGLSRDWGDRPLYVVLAAMAAAIALDLALYDSIWGPPLGVVLIVWFVVVFGFLGVSFILSAIIGTPGCEMRAIPDLWGRLTGRARMEHACPGPIHAVDVWERRRASAR